MVKPYTCSARVRFDRFDGDVGCEDLCTNLATIFYQEKVARCEKHKMNPLYFKEISEEEYIIASVMES